MQLLTQGLVKPAALLPTLFKHTPAQAVHRFETRVTRSAEGKTGRVFVGDLSDENAMDLAGKLVSEFFVYTVRAPATLLPQVHSPPLCSNPLCAGHCYCARTSKLDPCLALHATLSHSTCKPASFPCLSPHSSVPLHLHGCGAPC